MNLFRPSAPFSFKYLNVCVMINEQKILIIFIMLSLRIRAALRNWLASSNRAGGFEDLQIESGSSISVWSGSNACVTRINSPHHLNWIWFGKHGAIVGDSWGERFIWLSN